MTESKPIDSNFLELRTSSLDCVHCGLCIEACPTYDVLGTETDSPRGRIYLMRAIAEGRIDSPTSVRPALDRCLGCRACETACPSGVRYGQMIEHVRSAMEQHWPTRGFSAWLRKQLLAHLITGPRRLWVAFTLARASEMLGLRWLAARTGLLPDTMNRLVPYVPKSSARRRITGLHHPTGIARGRVMLFVGCIMEQVFGDINRATLDLLLANGFEVEVPKTQRCCGALQLHNGQAEVARGLALVNVAAFGESELPIIHNSAGCGAALAEYDQVGSGDAAHRAFAKRCRDITEFLAEVGLTATPAPFPHRVAYDAPCHLCHAQGVREQPVDLMREVPGLELAPHPDSDTCCGSAGIYNILQPELAAEIGRNKARALEATGAEVVATGNPGCMMQIRAHLAEAGSKTRVVHPVELLLPRRGTR